MISIEEDWISKRIGRTRRKARWSRGKREPNHLFSKIILKNSQLPRSPR